MRKLFSLILFFYYFVQIKQNIKNVLPKIKSVFDIALKENLEYIYKFVLLFTYSNYFTQRLNN